MATPTTRGRTDSRSQPEIPALEPGDHLQRDEFERRYDAMPDLKKAELIEGVVYMPSPVRLGRHGGPHADLITWVGTYRLHTPGVLVGNNSTIRLDMDNAPQPDALMIVDPNLGGRAQIDADDYVTGSPEWVGEVSASTASFDLHTKLRVYRRNQVLEYVVWRVLDQALDWFVLRQNEYERLSLHASGVYRSEVFPGLWLDAAALARFDLASVHQVLQQGLASPEHQAFVARLRQALPGTP